MKKGIVDTVGDGYFDIAWNEANGLAILFCHCVSLRRETVLQSVQAWGPSLEDHEDYRNYREIVLAAAFLAAWRLLAAEYRFCDAYHCTKCFDDPTQDPVESESIRKSKMVGIVRTRTRSLKWLKINGRGERI